MSIASKMRTITVEEPCLHLGMALGEGCVWDTRTQRLYFVDIDGRKVFTYEPSTGIHGFQLFDKKMTALALRQTEPGLVATNAEGYVIISPESIPFPPTNGPSPASVKRFPFKTPLQPPVGTNRFNEAAVDPQGRFLAGTMGHRIGDFDGTLYVSERDENGNYIHKTLVKGLTCSNGMDWTEDGKTMYFTDSWTKEIVKYDYDLATAEMTNRRIFSRLDPDRHGWPDGLCLDNQGGVWSSRWQGGKVIRFDPTGEIDVIIEFPKAWNITCAIFGGPRMDSLYVTSANSTTSGDDSECKPCGGDLFVVDGLGFSGRERNRFKG